MEKKSKHVGEYKMYEFFIANIIFKKEGMDMYLSSVRYVSLRICRTFQL